MDGMLFFKQNSSLSTDSVKWYRFTGLFIVCESAYIIKNIIIKNIAYVRYHI